MTGAYLMVVIGTCLRNLKFRTNTYENVRARRSQEAMVFDLESKFYLFIKC